MSQRKVCHVDIIFIESGNVRIAQHRTYNILVAHNNTLWWAYKIYDSLASEGLNTETKRENRYTS